jgi:hypothetical protein
VSIVKNLRHSREVIRGENLRDIFNAKDIVSGWNWGMRCKNGSVPEGIKRAVCRFRWLTWNTVKEEERRMPLIHVIHSILRVSKRAYHPTTTHTEHKLLKESQGTIPSVEGVGDPPIV